MNATLRLSEEMAAGAAHEMATRRSGAVLLRTGGGVPSRVQRSSEAPQPFGPFDLPRGMADLVLADLD